jgi:ABC-2 type transport system permease protein
LAQWLGFSVSLWLAVTVSFGLRFIANLAVFWTIEVRGVISAHTLAMVALSGFILPLTFYPSGVAEVLRLLPWASAVQAPIDVFLGHHSMGTVIGLQAFWTAALLALGHVLGAAAHRKLVVQGG